MSATNTCCRASKGLEPIPTAVAHPCDCESLRGPVIAFQEGIIEPILVGPESKIRSVAEEFGIDLHGIRIVNAAHSHDSAAISPFHWCAPAMPRP